MQEYLKHKIRIVYVLFIIYIFIPQIILSNDPVVIKGEIRLNEKDISSNNYLLLRGEWELYWNQLLTPDNIDTSGLLTGYIEIPGKWNQISYNEKKLPGLGYATLRLKISTDKPGKYYALKFLGIASSSRVYLNDKLIFQSGIPGISEDNSDPGSGNGLVQNITLEEENELIIQISNFNVKLGGMEDVYFGKTSKLNYIERARSKSAFFLFGSFLIMALYHIGLFLIRKKNRSALYFGIFTILLAIRTIIVIDRLILDIIQMNWEWLMKFEFLTYYAAVPVFFYFTKSIFPDAFSKIALKLTLYISILFISFVIFISSPYFTYSLIYFQIITGICGLYITYISIVSIKQKKEEAIIFLLGWLVLFISVINDILYYNEIIHFSSNLSSVGLFIFIIFQAYLLAAQFSKAVIQSEKLTKKLNYTNRNLTKIVDFRTNELEKQKQELINQKILIEDKNKDITDSINYAQKIQTAVLPQEDNFKECFYDYFIYYKPKDIVSGDFYWIKRLGNKIIVIAADCTGHGVPGAFMSLLGIAFLSEIVNNISFRQELEDKDITSKILHRLRKRIKGALRQTGEINEAFDGIDMALCIVDYVENKLIYSGANNSLYIYSKAPKIFNPKKEYIESKKIIIDGNENGLMGEIKANRMPIGTYLEEKPFTSYEFNLDEIDCIYMFSDGYTDQVGGENNTKFRLKRLKQLILDIAEKPMSEQKEILTETIDKWTSREIGQIDDITVIGIKVHADREERSFGIF